MNAINRVLSLDREDMTDIDRELFLTDLKKLTDEYFDGAGTPSLEITRTDEGFLVCLLFTANRIKNVKKVR